MLNDRMPKHRGPGGWDDSQRTHTAAHLGSGKRALKPVLEEIAERKRLTDRIHELRVRVTELEKAESSSSAD